MVQRSSDVTTLVDVRIGYTKTKIVEPVITRGCRVTHTTF